MRMVRRAWLVGAATAVGATVLGAAADSGLTPAWAEETLAATSEQGSLTGRIVFEGERPKNDWLRVDIPKKPSAELLHYANLKLKDKSLLVGEDGGLRNVVVWVSDKRAPVPVAPRIRRLPLPAVLKFEEGLFEPRVLAFEAWRVLELRNEDAFVTNFHWWAGGEDSLNQTLRGKEHAQFTIPAQELPIRVSSNIYRWPKAWLFPVAHPYFAVTDATGAFRIDRLPVGDWEFRVWHEKFGFLTTAAAPDGKFQWRIRRGVNELDTICFRPPAEEPPAKIDPQLAELRRERVRKHEKGNASEFAGKWTMRLPAGFEYAVELKPNRAGLLEMTSADGGQLLLGEFTCQGTELFLVHSRHERVDDYIWQYRDGKFVLTYENQGHGSHYVGATLRRGE